MTAAHLHPAIARLDLIRQAVEDVAADGQWPSQTRMLAAALESTIANLLDLIEREHLMAARSSMTDNVYNHDVLAEIDRQRDLGWPDFHPEHYCHRCGGKNVRSWWIDSDRFNVAMGPPSEHKWNGIICPGCFVELHEAATGMQTTWKLIPDPTHAFRWADATEVRL